jgi:DNA-binding response OmpR family regulator
MSMSGSRGKILVVDDEVAVAEMLADFLTEQGYQVTMAHGGVEALAKIDLEHPQVILLDIRMHGMDGVEVLRRIGSFDKQVGILMISGNGDIDLAKQTIEMGAFDYTLKPVDLAFLSRTVDKMVAQASASVAPSAERAPETTPSAHNLLYDLALEIIRVARCLLPMARESVGRELEQVALVMVQQSAGGERSEIIRTLNQIRTLLRFAKDLADITDDVHRALEASVAKARRSIGLS